MGAQRGIGGGIGAPLRGGRVSHTWAWPDGMPGALRAANSKNMKAATRADNVNMLLLLLPQSPRPWWVTRALRECCRLLLLGLVSRWALLLPYWG